MTDSLRDALVERLEAENDELRERVRQLEDELGAAAALPLEWRLTGREEAVFRALIGREQASKDSIMAAIYAGDPEQAEAKIVDVFIHKIRRKLKPYGITISTIWGRGYALDPGARARLRGAMLTRPAEHRRMTGT